MTPLTWNTSTITKTYGPASAQKAGPLSGSSVEASDAPADDVKLSPAALQQVALTGRIAANVKNGKLTSDQAEQVNSQMLAIHNQIVADRQANGGELTPNDAQTIQDLQKQLHQTLYSDTHNGDTPPADATVTQAGRRQAMETGRIALGVKSGNLSADQAKGLYSQLATIHDQIAADKQANGGSLSAADAEAIDQLQSQLSQQIHDAAAH